MQRRHPDSTFPIVGIGASAGGLEALGHFLAQVPSGSGLAFVIVQHHAPEHQQMLAELLQRHTQIPVVALSHNTAIQPEHIYVAPQAQKLQLRGNTLLLKETSDPRERLQPIDEFFQSLADERQERSIGVILSGTGSDGTLGLEAIRGQAGLTAAQTPESAHFDEMPRQAIGGGLVDIVAPAAELPGRILETLRQLRTAQPELARTDTDGSGLTAILSLLHQQTGQDFTLYKQNTLYRRIERRMGLARCSSIGSYLALLQQQTGEADILLKELLISVTRFFRDPEVWQRLIDEVFPALLASRRDGDCLRAWVPGCATGEEAYTLAMAFCEALQRTHPQRNIGLQIFATDLNHRAIARARKGCYPAAIAADLSAERLQQFFTADAHGYQIQKKIREMVIFAPHNLLADPPFSRLDLLSCRNLLIYLSPDIHTALLSHFHYSMNADGYLLLGSSESIGNAVNLFTPLAGAGQLYRRLDNGQQAMRFDFLSRAAAVAPALPTTQTNHPMKPAIPTDLKALSDRLVLQHYAPTAILTNDAGDILHISGKTDRYLQLAEGRANLNIMALVRDFLRAPLSEAFQDARQLNQPIRLPVEHEGSRVEIGVFPLPGSGALPGMLVALTEQPGQADAGDSGDDRNIRQSNRLLMLEQMLRQTREALQTTREEMQTSREELTSTNEELQSTNEELTTSAEELRTMNEELVRARTESEQALSRYTDLFDSAPVGYFTLDCSGCITQANLAGAALLGMERERVAGSRFAMFVTEADRPRFSACLAEALDCRQAQPCEVALWRDQNQALQVRISASAADDGQSCRVVAIDVSEQKRTEAALQASEERFRMVWETASDVVVVLDGDNRIRYANPATTTIFGYHPDELLGQDLSLLQPERLREPHNEAMRHFLDTGRKKLDWRAVQTTGLHRSGREFPVEISFSYSSVGGNALFAGIIRDASARKKAEARQASHARIMALIANNTPLPDILDAIVRAVEAENPQVLCSVLLLDADGQHIRLGAAPSLPGYFNQAVDGMEIGRHAGPCDTAMHLNQRMIVPDIQSDPRWKDYSDVAARAGLAACWSEPIRDERHQVLGTFVIYHRTPREPGPADFDTLANSCHLASIAIERHQAEQALREERDISNQLLNSLPGVVYLYDHTGKFLRWNENFEHVTGYSGAEIANMHPLDFFRGNDLPLLQQRISEVFSTGSGQVEAGFVTKDGRSIPYFFTGRLIHKDGKSCLVGMGIDISERRQAEQALRESESRFRRLFEYSKDAMVLAELTPVPAFIDANHEALRLFGIADETMLRQLGPISMSPEFQPDGSRSDEKARRMIEIALREGSHFFEWQHRTVDGKPFLCEILLSALTIDGRQVLQATIRDITARRQAEDQLQLAAMVYQYSSEAMLVTDAEDRIIAINRAFTALTGYSSDEVLGRSPNILRAEQQAGDLEQAIATALTTGGSWQGELRGRRKNGEIFAEWLSINTAYHENGTVHRRVALFSDISEKKKNEELIWQQANFDFLTGLPNRRMFYERLAQEIRKSNRDMLSVALMFIDLDRFKEINDTLGHDIGDTLLKDATERLRHCIRETDFLGRLGGDEFAVVLSELGDPASIDRIAQDILDSMAKPFQLGMETAYISASIGISLYPEDGNKLETLLKNADQAMYAAKHLGRNRFSYFTPFMQEAAQIRMRLASDLRVALNERQFHVYYQPIVELATGDIHKAEALIRWQHPTEGLVSPAAFIPIAEETGLISDIGDWVFREAALQAARWRELHHPGFQISVNKSPAQFRETGSRRNQSWVDQLQALGLPGQCIAVEITEGLLMDASADNLSRFQSYRDAGIQVALDDFGTGYSSLSYLKKFDIDYLKIDQSFTRNLAPGTEDMALCEAIIVMAHKLQLKVIAEGIETEQQRDLLIAAGCDYGQGYLFSRPLPATDCESLLQRGRMSASGAAGSTTPAIN